MNTRSPTIYVVDDDPEVRKSVERLLRANRFDTIGFSCARHFLAHPRPPGDVCVVLDVNLPDLDGLQLQALISAEQGPPVVFVTGHDNIPLSVRAIKAGAMGFLQKPFREEDLLTAIGAALLRHRELRLHRENKAGIRTAPAQVAVNEREVIAQVISGEFSQEIASDLGICGRTLKVRPT